MHTEETSAELLAWPFAPAIPAKKGPPNLPLGLMLKAPPPLYGPLPAGSSRMEAPPPLYGPIEAKPAPHLRDNPPKRPPPPLNDVVNLDGQSILPPPKSRSSAKPGASDPKAHSQQMHLPKCGVLESDELLKCVTKMSLMSDDERKLMVEQLSPFSEESESEGC